MPMVKKDRQWVLITALLLVVTWRPSANYQILLHLVVCAGAIMVILALVFIKLRIETQYAVNKRVTLGFERGGPERHYEPSGDDNGRHN
ncbi:MAG: hypothetical protein WCA91_17860 [Candidatus Acidiferrales bacterium]